MRWQDRLRGTGEATTVLLSPQAVYAGGMWQGRALLRAYGLDGTLLWQCRSAAPGEAIQSLHLARAQGADATLFAVRRTGQVQAFQADGGQQRWRVPARPGTVILTATRTPTLLLLAGFADGDWSVQALDLATGQERWRVRDADPAGVAWATTLVVGDHVYVGGGFLQGLTRTIVRAYDAVTGAEVWEAMGAEFADADEGEISSPVWPWMRRRRGSMPAVRCWMRSARRRRGATPICLCGAMMRRPARPKRQCRSMGRRSCGTAPGPWR